MNCLKLVCILVVLGLIVPGAFADQITVSLTNCNTSGGGGICNAFPNPPGGTYATVTKTLVDANGNPISSGTGNVEFQITFTSPLLLIGNGFGFDGPAGLTSSNIVGSLPNGSLPTDYGFQVGPTSNFDGFGSFDYAITGPNVGQGTNDGTLISSLTFFILGNYSSVEAFDVANSKGHDFAADVYVSTNCASENAGCTGFISDGPPPPQVPEPATLTLLGTALVGAASLLRKRLNK